MKITNPITLDVARSNSYICLLGKQFDSNSRYLQVTLTNNGQPLPIPSGASVILRATRADGTAATVAGTVNGDGSATVEIDDYILEAAGNATLSIEVSSAGEVLTSASFNLNVQKADASGWVRVYVAAASLSAGNYYITIGGTSYSFTTTQTIPAGGMIYFASTGGTAQTRDASGNVLDASLTLTEASTGTELTSDVATMSFLNAIAGRVAILEDTDNAVVGSAEALLGGPAQDDAVYTIRASANTARKALRAIKGVTMGWNQPIEHGNFDATTGWSNIASVSGNVGTSISLAKYVSLRRDVSAAVGHVYFITATATADTSRNLRLCFFDGGTSLDGGSFAVTAGTFTTFSSVVRLSSAANRFALANWSDGNAVIQAKNVWYTDLTLDLGSAIADYALSLETGTPGAGVAWLAENFPELMSKYHAYAPGSLQSTKVSASKASGFNIWDETWRFDAGQIKALNLIPVLPNETYYFKCPVALFAAYKYDAAGQSLGAIPIGNNSTFTTDAQTHFIWFSVNGSVYGSTYKGDICINLSNPLLNGTYRPHAEHSYPIQPVELRGVLGLDANNKVITTGDEYKSDGTITRKAGYVDLGSISWNVAANASGQTYNTALASVIRKGSGGHHGDYILSNLFVGVNKSSMGNLTDGEMSIDAAGNLQICKPSFANYSGAQIKTALSGVYLVYELATPTTTETATPFTELQRIDDGIEEFVDAEVEAGNRDVAIPAGTDALVYRDLAALLGAIPNPPTTAGTYTLHATVTSTNATFSWS